MGGFFGGGPKIAPPPGPTPEELEAQRRADKKIADSSPEEVTGLITGALQSA